MDIFKIGIIVYILIFNFVFVEASVSVGNIDSNYKFTKVCHDESCSSFGGVNLKPTINTNTPGALPVVITDTSITGHIWGNQIGWINMSPVNGGVVVDPTNGVFSGKAFSSSGSWVNFSPTGYGVTLVDNGSGSNFSGWAWVSGANGGWMKFDCADISTCVKTDWRILSYRNNLDTPIIPQTPTSSSSGFNRNYPIMKEDKCLNIDGLQDIVPSGYSLKNNLCVINVIDKTKNEDINNTIQYLNVEPNVSKEFAPYVCIRYLRSYISLNKENNKNDVKKLQIFLNDYQSEKLLVDGIYKKEDFDAVKRFQLKYTDQILLPWGHKKATGVVGKTTVAKINLVMCSKNIECPYFKSYAKKGDKSFEIVKIQDFLNIINAPTSGYPSKGIKLSKLFTSQTENMLKEYQTRYKDTVLKPWNFKKATGLFQKTTSNSANNLMNCVGSVNINTDSQ